jgi:5'-phosphate synthase pdxT subunit
MTSQETLVIGVLSLQGGFAEHVSHFVSPSRLGLSSSSVIEVRTPEELSRCDALVLPGGESTAMGLIAARQGMLEPLREWVNVKKRPTWGTCAGLVMLSDKAEGAKEGGQALLGGINCKVHRNFFGSQMASFEAPLVLKDETVRNSVLGSRAKDANAAFTGVFIRAPAILEYGEDVEPLVWVAPRLLSDANVPDLSVTSPSSRQSNNQPVLVGARSKHLFVTAFHPELTNDCGFHRFFAESASVKTGKKLLFAINETNKSALKLDRLPGAPILDAEIRDKVVAGVQSWMTKS